VLMLTTSIATAIGNPLNFEKQTISNKNQLTYTWSFIEPSFQTITADGSEYTTINMPGCIGRGMQAGEPQMPMKMIQLVLPPKTTVASVTVEGTAVEISQAVDLVAKPVLPYQKSVPFGNNEPQEFVLNSDIYSSNALYPSTTYSQYHIGYSHGYAILDLGLSPMQYSPNSGTLTYYPKMTVAINLKNNGYVNQLFRNNPDDEAYVKTLVLNPEIAQLYQTNDIPTFEYPGGLCDPSGHYDYVIITTTQNGLDYWDTSGSTPYNWESLMDSHAGDGLTSTIVTIQDINACSDYYNSTSLFNDSKAHIREFCKDAYQDWGTSYILIGGDADYIPARLMDSGGEYGVDSDLYWSNIDNDFNSDHDSQWGEEGDTGFDLYAELFVGRIVCDEPQDVSNWLTKSLYYAESAEWDYLDNAAFYGGNTGWNCQGDDFMDYSAIKGTDEWLGPSPDEFPSWVGFQFGFETWNEVNPGNQFNLSVKCTEAPSPNPGWSGSGITGFRDAINNDLVTIISGIAHADNQMSLDVYASDWETLYHNEKPFFIHDYGCHCGDFDAGDGVLESMLFHSDTNLAFGCVYNTGYGWGNLYCTNSSSAFQAKEFWRFFLDVENLSGDLSNWQIGRSHAHSKDMMAPMIDWDGGTWREIVQCCLLFGDPAQQLRTPHPSQAPTQPTKPVGPTLGIWNQEYTYNSKSTDPENDQIYYLFDWDDGTNSGWLGPYSSGQTITASHIWTVLGTFEVKVKARDTWGAASIWSESLNVTITDNTPPEVPEISGPAEGKPGSQYLYNLTTDGQGQNIYYFVDWGDNTTTGWLGPYVSGTEIHVTHSWSEKGTYTIKAKAKDTFDAESDWGTLQVVMPTEYKFSLNGFLEHLLGMFPHMFPILRHLMGY
ncbi:MAG: hypothetical protein IMZ53_15400, partial [Thermoplasmata archaeon]|nr:hypothetical protein [Thermoplasmata archaeon]